MATLSQLRFLLPGQPRSGAHRPPEGERQLEIASDGADLVRSLQDESDTSYDGLRIVVDPTHLSLSMSLTDRRAGDLLVMGHGAHVFLTVAAAERLQGCTLRAGAIGSGSLFYLDRSLQARSLGVPASGVPMNGVPASAGRTARDGA